MKQTILRTENLAIGYGKTAISNNVNIEISRGSLVSLLGLNGCGKSTLIRTLAGMQPPISGEIFIEEEPINRISAHQLAQHMSVVLTDRIDSGNFTVYDIVSLGRFPHTNWFGSLSGNDHELIKNSLKNVGMLNFANRNFSELSDGEQQRVLIAKSLAQNTPIILLDEPTAHLDYKNREEIMRLLHNFACTEGKTILLSTHEVELASQFSHSILVFTPQGVKHCHEPQKINIQDFSEK